MGNSKSKPLVETSKIHMGNGLYYTPGTSLVTKNHADEYLCIGIMSFSNGVKKIRELTDDEELLASHNYIVDYYYNHSANVYISTLPSTFVSFEEEISKHSNSIVVNTTSELEVIKLQRVNDTIDKNVDKHSTLCDSEFEAKHSNTDVIEDKRIEFTTRAKDLIKHRPGNTCQICLISQRQQMAHIIDASLGGIRSLSSKGVRKSKEYISSEENCLHLCYECHISIDGDIGGLKTDKIRKLFPIQTLTRINSLNPKTSEKNRKIIHDRVIKLASMS